jgi:glycosyltransferase involved in cell wall biosynthesis
MKAALIRVASVRKHILMIIPNLDFGGAQRSFSNLSIELSKKHRLYVAVFNTHHKFTINHGGHLIDLNVPGANTVAGKLYYFFARIWRLRAIKRKYSIDVALSFLEGADYVNVLSKRKECTIISVRGSKLHDAEIKGGLGWLRHHVLMPAIYRKADHIITVSEGIKQELIQHYGQRPGSITTIYNFYDAEAIAQLKMAALPPVFEPIFRHPVIITSGRLHVQKNIAGLLDVFASIPQRYTHKLVVLGDGELRETLLQRADLLGLRSWASWQHEALDESRQVFFAGYQDNPFPFISRATLYICTSSWEGFPNSLAEAMVCGVPVVSTDCPTGPRELLAGMEASNTRIQDTEIASCGYLMPLLNEHPNTDAVRVWAAGIQPLLNNANERERLIGNAALRMRELSRENVFKKWEQILGELASGVKERH